MLIKSISHLLMKFCDDVNLYFCTDFHNIETPNLYYVSIYSSNILFTFSKKKSCFVPVKKSSQKNIPRLTPTWLSILFFPNLCFIFFSRAWSSVPYNHHYVSISNEKYYKKFLYKIFPCPICNNPSKNLNFSPHIFISIINQ